MTAPDHASRAHARLSPSAAHRWTVCTASVGFIEANKDKLPPTDSEFTREGTHAHEVAQTILTGGEMPKDTPKEMQEHVLAYRDYVRSQVQPEDQLFVERRIPLFYAPEERGTSDIVLFGKRRLKIIDLKYGRNWSYYAKKSEQLAIYAESTVAELEITHGPLPEDFPIELEIYQPRDRNDDTVVRDWRITRRQLAEFCKSIQEAADLIRQRPQETKFVADPDAQCKGCQAAGLCHARGTHGLQVISDEPVDVVLKSELRLPEAQSLTREQRQRILTHAKGIKSFLDAVEEQEVHELSKGAPPLLFKLVEGKSNRKWADEATATIALSDVLTLDAIAPRSLISPAQAEKLLSPADRKQIGHLVVKPPGAPTLVPVSDKRPALDFNPTAGLENLSDVI